MYAWLYVLLYTIVDSKSSLELVLYVWFISTLNKALNWMELNWKNHHLSHVTDKLDHKMLYWVHITMSQIQTQNFSGIGTVCSGSCKSNYHMTTTVPVNWVKLLHQITYCNSLFPFPCFFVYRSFLHDFSIHCCKRINAHDLFDNIHYFLCQSLQIYIWNYTV